MFPQLPSSALRPQPKWPALLSPQLCPGLQLISFCLLCPCLLPRWPRYRQRWQQCAVARPPQPLLGPYCRAQHRWEYSLISVQTTAVFVNKGHIVDIHSLAWYCLLQRLKHCAHELFDCPLDWSYLLSACWTLLRSNGNICFSNIMHLRPGCVSKLC